MKSKTSTVAKGIAALLVCTLTAYVALVLRAKFQWGGRSPDEQVLGTVADVGQRAMDQYCTGVVVTRRSTWLIGRREGEQSEFPFAAGAPDLSALLAPADAKSSGSGGLGALLRGSRSEVTFISRLDAAGKFQLIGVVPAAACLVDAADGERVLLMTGLSAPGQSASRDIQPDAVFQSDDQGASWQWRKEGFFPDSGHAGWDLKPYVYDAKQIWAWHVPDVAEGQPPTGPSPSGLQYSPDGGRSIEDVLIDEPLWVPLETVRQRVEGDMKVGEGTDANGETRQHVVQFGPDRAAVWLSQTYRYAFDGDRYLSHSYRVTRFASLTRANGAWHMGKLAEIPDLAIDKVLDNRAGHVVAVIERSDGRQVALLNPSTLQWDVQGALPSAFDPLPSWTNTRDVRVGNDVVVVSVMSEYRVPRWFYPWGDDAAAISSDAVFYSTDWGRSWRRLSIAGYLGVLGIDAPRNRVVWGSGNWYDSRDTNVRSDGLY